MPASSESSSDSETETLILSPFEVQGERDVGYVATNTLAGGRLNTPLDRTPVAISVLTSEFLADVGATNITQAMEYATGAGNDIGDFTGIGLTTNDYNFQIRGYRGVQATREYFTTLIGSDAFNLDRIDIARGPNSILFGIGGAGGIIDATPKRADLQRDFTQLQFWYGKWSKQRASLDLNRTLSDEKLGVRVNLLHQDADGYRDFEKDDQKRGALAVTYRPTDSTTIRFQGEIGDLHQRRPRPWLPYEGFSAWQANGSVFVPFGTPEIAETPGGPFSQFEAGGGPLRTFGVGRFGVFTDAGGHPLNEQPLWFGLSSAFANPPQGQRFFRVSHSANLPGFNNPANIADESLFPRTGNTAGPGNYIKTDYDMVALFVDQRIGRNFFLQGAASRQFVKTFQAEAVPFTSSALSLAYDVTTTLPTFNADGTWNGTLSPNAIETNNGLLGGFNFNATIPNPYVGEFLLSAIPQYTKSWNVQEDYRLSGTYQLDLERWGKHSLLGFVSRTNADRESQVFVEANIAGDRPGGPDSSYSAYSNNLGLRRIAHIRPFSDSLAERGMPDPLTHPIPSGRILGAPQFGFVDGWVRDGWSETKTTVDSAAFALQSSFFEERLTTTAGVRRDTMTAFGADQIFGQGDQVVDIERRADAEVDESATTYTIGGVYAFNDRVSVYANRSTNFRPQGEAALYGDVNEQPLIGPLRGKGSDAGFKFKFLGDRVHATLGWFKVEQTNAAAGFNGVIDLYVDAIWTAIANNGPGSEVPEPHQAEGADTVAAVSDGYEFEVVANLTKNWRLLLNVSNAENVVSGVNARIIAYVNDHVAEWQSQANLAYDTTGPAGNVGNNTVGALITALQEQIAIDAARNGMQDVNSRPWNANAFTSYTFDTGALRGLTIGGGLNYRGDAILGIDQSDPLNFRMVKGNDYTLASAMAAYQFNFGEKVRARLQLNVDNLFDNDDLQVLASSVQDGTVNTLTYFFEPRRYNVSLTFDF